MVLRIHIDGEWTAEEFSRFFYAIQDLSYFWIQDMEYRFAPSAAAQTGTSIHAIRMGNAELRVLKVQYASPGFTDLAGFGAILSEIRQLLEFLIEKIIEREDRKLARERARLENAKIRVEILHALRSDRENLPYSAAKLMEAETSEDLIEAIASGRIKGVEILDEK